MPAKSGSKQPKYSFHNRRGQAVVTLVDRINRRRIVKYLGVYDSPESRAKYHNLIGKWEANDRRLDPAPTERKAETPAGVVSVRSVLNGYTDHIANLVSPTRADIIRRTLGLVIDQYGDTSASKFGPLKLKDVRTTFVGLGWVRDTINKETQTVVRAFEWGVSEQLVAVSVYTALTTVSTLRAGELGVVDGDGKGCCPAPESDITDAIKFMPRPVRAMIELQLLTGMRPGEVRIMRAVEITIVSDKAWYYEPAEHKTARLNKCRRVRLGPRCIEIITPFMQGLRPDVYLFNPRQANAEGKAKDASGKRRADQKPNRTKTDRVIGDHYTKDAYRIAVQRACKKAGVPKFNPKQVRKNGLTRIERKYGLEVASKVADHSEATTTAKHYIDRDNDMLNRVAIESA